MCPNCTTTKSSSGQSGTLEAPTSAVDPPVLKREISNNTKGYNQQHEIAELNILSTAELDQLEKDVGHMKLSDFTLLREKYDSRKLALTTLNHQLLMYSDKYKKENRKPKEEQDKEVLEQYLLLEKEVKSLATTVDEIEKKILSMIDSPSPFAIANIKFPNLGGQDTYEHKKLECIPYTDEKTSVREVWNFLVEVGEDLGLSEKGFKI